MTRLTRSNGPSACAVCSNGVQPTERHIKTRMNGLNSIEEECLGPSLIMQRDYVDLKFRDSPFPANHI